MIMIREWWHDNDDYDNDDEDDVDELPEMFFPYFLRSSSIVTPNRSTDLDNWYSEQQ